MEGGKYWKKLKNKMKITIDLTKKEAKHIKGNHTFYDCCSKVEGIMKKVKKEINKKYNPE